MGKLSGAGELVLDDLQTLCTLGFTGVRTDGQLIALFLSGDQPASERAFRVLVERHGPVVFGVCCRLLADRHAAEDALQATFLVLAKRARSIRRQESVSGWLHRVARRIAVRAGKKARRLPSAQDVVVHAESLAEMCDPRQSLERSELRTVLDTEIDRLSPSSRQVVVLCDLEGLTYEQAAERLRWPVGTVKSRLSRARVQLRERLVRRGFGPAIVGGAGIVWSGEAKAALSSSLAQTVVKTALGDLAGTSAMPAMVASLVGDELRAGAAGSLRFVVTTLVLLGSSVAFWAFSGDPNPPPEQAVKPLAFQGPDEKLEAIENDASSAPKKVSASGRVVDVQGRPIGKARVFLREWASHRGFTAEQLMDDLLRRTQRLPDILAETRTSTNGTFRFENVVAPAFAEAEDNRKLGVSWFPWDLVILAEGHGLAWVRLTPQNQHEALTITLPKEASLRGRVTTVNGKPIKGATVRASEITDLGAGIDERQSTAYRLCLDWSSVPLETKTDADGCFVLHGLVPERQLSLLVLADGFQRSSLFAATTVNPPPDIVAETLSNGRTVTKHHPVLTGDLAVTLKESNHQLSGRLIFESTGKPTAGAYVIVANEAIVQTDRDGRFTVNDLVAGTIKLSAQTKENDSAPLEGVEVEIPEASKVVEQTFRMPRGLAVSGRIIDDRGAGVEGAKLRYENLSNGKGVATEYSLTAATDAKGSFRLNVPAGPGMIVIFEAPQDYLGPGGRFAGSAPEERFSRSVDGASGTVIDRLDFSLSRRGRGMVQALDPDGRPLEGVEVRCYGLEKLKSQPLLTNADGRAEVVGLDHERVTTIDLIHPAKRLGRRVEISASEARATTGGEQIKLTSLSSLEGRVLGENGKPLTGLNLGLRTRAKGPEPIVPLVESRDKVNSDGSFFFDDLIPGVDYYVNVEAVGHAGQTSKTITAKPGIRQQLEPFRLPVTNRFLHGIVVDPQGRPVAGVTVSFENDRSELHNRDGCWFMNTDATGRFELNGLPQGEISVMAYRDPNGPDRWIRNLVREKIRPNQADVRLVLPDAHRRLQGIEH